MQLSACTYYIASGEHVHGLGVKQPLLVRSAQILRGCIAIATRAARVAA